MGRYDYLEKIREIISESKYGLDGYEFEQLLCEVDDLVQYYSEDEDEYEDEE